MIKVSVMYPNSDDAKFDVDYYCNTHIPLVGKLLGDAIKGGNVDAGLAGAQPGEKAPFIAMGHLQFENVDAFQTSFGPHADEIMADLANFTNVKPQIQISEIRI